MKKIFYFLFLLAPTFLLAQDVALFNQYNGKFDFTAIGNTLNTGENGSGGPCEILTQSSADFNLDPAYTVVEAQLYWSGSGPLNENSRNVTLNAFSVTAEREFTLNLNGRPFFAANADVTDIIIANGNGEYTLSDLDLTAIIENYCGSGTNFGGWSITIVYKDPTTTLNQISLFDGLEYVSAGNPTLEILLESIDIANANLAKIGFLAWEGDRGISVNETLLINGNLISDPPFNPDNNAFNGTNSYTGSEVLYNMDLDVYPLEDIVDEGDTTILINLTSGQDFVMINNIITNVNSELPDATIRIDDIGNFCADRNLDIDYTVFNINSTAPLPPNTPIAFYANNILIGQSQTTIELLTGEFESGTITLFIPTNTPDIFTLKAVIDDDGSGNGIVPETNENNNDFELEVNLALEGVNLGPDIESCLGDSIVLNSNIDDPSGFTFQWFLNGLTITGADDPLYIVIETGTYRVDATNSTTDCELTGEIFVNFNALPIPGIPDDLAVCDEIPNDGFAAFDLTLRDA
ncbi:MAG: gliding motility-associated C-terminal domain-containing protein [Flavobacteriaceae bacterium]|nr:gliding motility-associated C-terminal domain-containing protein [Flavobacteriaceae bacterium]